MVSKPGEMPLSIDPPAAIASDEEVEMESELWLSEFITTRSHYGRAA